MKYSKLNGSTHPQI